MNLRTRAAFWSARTPVPLYTAIYPECHQAFRKLKAFREDAFPFQSIDWAAVVLKAALIVGVGVLVAVAVRIVRSRESKSDVVRAGERSQRPDPGPKSGRS